MLSLQLSPLLIRFNTESLAKVRPAIQCLGPRHSEENVARPLVDIPDLQNFGTVEDACKPFFLQHKDAISNLRTISYFFCSFPFSFPIANFIRGRVLGPGVGLGLGPG